MFEQSLPPKSEADAMEELVRMIWERYIKGRALNELLAHSLDGYKAQVVSNNGDGTLTVERPFDTDTPMTLKCPPSLAATAATGDQVLVVSLGNLSNAFALCNTDLTGMGADVLDSVYSATGDIAELTVDRLVTAKKVQRYMLGDTSDDNYVRIRDNHIQLVTASVTYGTAISSNGFILTNEDDEILISGTQNNPTIIHAHNRYGQALYWQKEPVGHTPEGYPIDAEGNRVFASVIQTEWPVFQYAYTEIVTASFGFEQVEGLYTPQIIIGAGDENGRSRGYLFKEQTDLLLRYVSSAGKNVDVKLSDSGFVDAMHRRLASCSINKSQGKVMYTVEGDNTAYQLSFSVSGSNVTFTWPDGHTCEVSIS